MSEGKRDRNRGREEANKREIEREIVGREGGEREAN